MTLTEKVKRSQKERNTKKYTWKMIKCFDTH